MLDEDNLYSQACVVCTALVALLDYINYEYKNALNFNTK